MRIAPAASLAFLLASPSLADVSLPAVFTDHMVLQRNRPVRVFGMAMPNEQVTVELRDPKGAVVRTARATGGQGGRFSVEFAPLAGSAEPMTLSATGANTVVVQDVVVGDVWVAGGQSNMEWSLGATGDQAADGVKLANDGAIRFLRTPHVTANGPAFTIAASWKSLSPDSAPSMGAVAFWFAQRLRKETGVPIGILEINWGGTRAEPWTDVATLGAEAMYTPRVAELAAAVEKWNSRSKQERDADYEAARRGFQEAGTRWWDVVNGVDEGAKARWFSKETPADAGKWSTVTLPMKWSASPERKDFDGVEWYRRTVEIPAAWAGKECFVDLGPIDDADVLFVDGRPIANTLGDIGTPRHYRIPGSLVKAGACTLAVELLDLHGEGGFMGSPQQMTMTCPGAGNASIPLAGEWLARRGRAATGIPAPPARPARDQAPGTGPGDPASMFNAMVAPFAGYAVRGAIWYQGESNAGDEADAQAYRTLLPLTIRSWRSAFEQPDMPFGIVSLAAYRAYDPNAVVAGVWPSLRDAQLAAERNSPNAGVVTTIDIGDANDIHPRNKRDVGYRLAAWAMATAYGKPETPWRGPRTKSARRDGDGIMVDFDVEGGHLGTRDGKAPTGFAVAGEDGKFVRATAEFRPPNSIRLSSPDVATPVEVRYAWQDNPVDATLVDEVSKLPAHPFRIRVEADPVSAPATPAK